MHVRRRAEKRSVNLRLTQAALRLLIMILIVYGSVTQWSVSRSLAAAEEHLVQQREQAERLREENTQLQQRINALEKEERWEHIARQQLGLVSPGEIVIYNVGD